MIYRTEHPKPQFMRDNWQNLNGMWDFEKDPGVSGKERGMQEASAEFSQKINVPFCLESKLSGIGDTDFINSVWYKREIEIEESKLENIVFLHFGAVDYETTVWVNGVGVGKHIGGYSSFKFDITPFLKAGKNVITVNAFDDTRSPLTPSGKQSRLWASHECDYTRTTGIWQTVWLEFVPKNHIEKTRYVTDIENCSVSITAQLVGKGTLKTEVFYKGKKLCETEHVSDGGSLSYTISLPEKHLWEPGHGRLYDLVFTYGEDVVKSYFGLRSLRLDGRKFLINEKSVFQRLILDQGFYPDGVYTAPSDAELEGDIDRSMALGFNGARLHEKVFEERFLYHCDRKGYIVWGEQGNWGFVTGNEAGLNYFLPEWMEVIERDFNHPAIVGWCPFNEVWGVPNSAVMKNIYLATKALDPTRPCIDVSGGIHVITDIMDDHCYAGADGLKEHYKNIGVDGTFEDRFEKHHKPFYRKDIPFFCSEFGGMRWYIDKENPDGWGYSNPPKNTEEFIEGVRTRCDVLMDNKEMFGFCYTQLTDVEQEQNGFYTFDRRAKVDPKIIHEILSRKAAIED